VISLDAVAEREGLSVADQIALQDAEQRRAITGRMLQTFIAANTVTLVGVALLAGTASTTTSPPTSYASPNTAPRHGSRRRASHRGTAAASALTHSYA
jgi:hypothetical protein